MFSRLGHGLARQVRARLAPSAIRITTTPTNSLGSIRQMGSGGHGLHISEQHQQVANVMTTLCWVWILWRCYEDGAVVLGLVHPWDAHGHGDGHGHGHGAHVHFKETSFDTTPEVEEVEEDEEGHGGHDEEEEDEEEE